MSLHSLAAGNDLHDDKRIKQDVRVVATSNVTVSAPGSTIDGVTLTSGDRVLLTAQAVSSQNGIYQWNGAASQLTRTSDATRDVDFVPGFLVFVREGTINHNLIWTHTTSGLISVGSTSLTFQVISSVGPRGIQGLLGPTGPQGPQGDPGDSTAAADPPYILIQDQKSSGTNGGTFTSGAFQTRDLTTIVTDTGKIATLGSNQITLPAGQYRVAINCPAKGGSGHMARLQNITDSATVLLGTVEFNSANSMTRSFVIGRFSISSTKVFEVQHRATNTVSTTGFGAPASFGVNEVYTSVEIWYLASPPPIGVQLTAQPPIQRARVQPQRFPSNTLLPV